jgi:hypothetical protein
LQWGVLLADGTNGPFKFEVQYLRALRQWRPEDYSGVAAQMIAEGTRETKALQAQSEAVRAEHGMSKEKLREYYREQREQAKLK